MTSGDTSPPATESRYDPWWWLAPLVTGFTILVLAVPNMILLGLAAGAPRHQVRVTYGIVIVLTAVGLVATFALPLRKLRGLRWAVASATMFCAAWPVLWLLGGGPHA